MATEKAPAYQWFVKDWRSSRATGRMSFAERGVYREMLDEQWEVVTLPDNAEAVADLIATTDAQRAEVLAAWPLVRRKFVTVEGGQIQNARLERCRKEFKAFVREKRKAGKARAATAARDEKGTFQAASTQPTVGQQTSSSPPAGIQPSSSSASASSSASSSASKKQEQEKAAASPPRRWQPREDPDDNLSVITKIAHEAIEHARSDPAFADLKASVKSLCAIRAIDYDAAVVGKAVESALAQRSKQERVS